MSNFGDTLTSGIQDVSALLPLLGTEQCERHTGSALERGFIYAAATPLSIFGSLGVVKTTFATLLATITFPFYGGKWLDDAGFGTSGSVSSMIVIANGSAEYGAEINLVKLLRDQHIDDPELVLKVEWSGWTTGSAVDKVDRPEAHEMSLINPSQPPPSVSPQTTHQLNKSHARKPWPVLPWNMKLIITSALAAMISLSPYFYLIHFNWLDPLAWTFPILRAFGTFLCVVVTQLSLQLRIHRLICGRLLLMKAAKRSLRDESVDKDILERRLHALSRHLNSLSDLEKAEPDAASLIKELRNILSIDWTLVAYQILIVIGMPMIVVGYVGCFNLVSQNAAPGPYIWLGIEATLSVLRLGLWGWNPKWDEGTGMKIQLKLPGETSLVSSPYNMTLLEIENQFRRRSSFVIYPEHNFLAAATRYTGPLQRFASDTVYLFYALVSDAKNQSKHLLTTVLDLHTRSTRTIYISLTGDPKVFSSTCQLVPRTDAMQVTLGHEMNPSELSRDELLDQVLAHSKQIANRLCGNGRIDTLGIEWTLLYSHSGKSPSYTAEMALNDEDKLYLGGSGLCIDKQIFCTMRGNSLEYYANIWESMWSLDDWIGLIHGLEVLTFMESVFLEVYLSFRDQELTERLAKVRQMDNGLVRRCSAEWIQGMQSRMTKEREEVERRLNRWRRYTNEREKIIRAWDKAQQDLARWRQSDKITDNILLQILDKLMDFAGAMRVLDMLKLYKFGTSPTSERVVQRVLTPRTLSLARRLKTVIGEGAFPKEGSPDPMVAAWFASTNIVGDQYLRIADTSNYILEGIHQNPSLKCIVLAPSNVGGLGRLLEVLRSKRTLTTLFDRDHILSASMLESNHHLLFLPGLTCQQQCSNLTEHPFCALIQRNRQEWKNWASATDWSRSDVIYTVGFQAFQELFPADIYAYGQDMMGAESVVMLYMRSRGQLRLLLHHRHSGTWDGSFKVLIKFGGVGEWTELCAVPPDKIPDQYTIKPHEIVLPVELSEGYHEIWIQVRRGNTGLYYLHDVVLEEKMDA